MKDILDTLIKLLGLADGLVRTVGWMTIGLVILSRWPEYNFITKYIVTLALTH